MSRQITLEESINDTHEATIKELKEKIGELRHENSVLRMMAKAKDTEIRMLNTELNMRSK